MLIIGMILAASVALSDNQKENLCQREYVSTGGLIETLRKDDGVREFKSDEGFIVFLDGNRHTLWWFSNDGGEGSIITCKTKVEGKGGYADSAVEADCGGASDRCVGQAQAMAKAKF